MRYRISTVLLVLAAAVLFMSTQLQAQKHELVHAKDGSGVFGYKDTPVQPWSGYHVHDPDRPAPPKVTPAAAGTCEGQATAPSDAVVLFDGTDLSKWEPNKWKVEDGCLVATEGPMRTTEEFGDCQLHLEWAVPTEPAESVWNRGNNGVFFLGDIEVQIFESYTTKIYPDGQAAAVYAQTPPLVNACRKPGEWEVYDIVFQAPKFDDAGKLATPARITMLHNGVLVHTNQEIYGNTPHGGLASYDQIPATGPLAFGAHGCPVRFRNIWIRPLATSEPSE
jgi:hypothetical protein